jgi:hypothetical protein
MNGKQILVGILLLAVVIMGVRQMPTVVAMTGSAFNVIGVVVLIAILGYAGYRILRE